jgi:hypothetical protein
VIGLGQIAPLLIQATFAFRQRSPRWPTAGASALVLIGGLLPRYTLLVAGRASADDPEATYTLAEACIPVALDVDSPARERAALASKEYPSSH